MVNIKVNLTICVDCSETCLKCSSENSASICMKCVDGNMFNYCKCKKI